MHPAAVRMVEAVAHHGCSRPEELHTETVGPAVGRKETVGREVDHTVVGERRTGREEVGHTAEPGEAVVRKAKEVAQGHHKVKEPVQGHHMAKELVQAVHRRATEPVQVVHRAKEPVQGGRMAMGHWEEAAGKETDWVEEDRKEELAEKVLLLLHSRSRMHPSCQSGPRSPAGRYPSACRPWAYRRR